MVSAQTLDNVFGGNDIVGDNYWLCVHQCKVFAQPSLSTVAVAAVKMVASLESLLWLAVVGALWGGTNPFLKKGASGVEKVEGKNILFRFLKEIYFLLMNWRYMIPFALNQSGSLLYFLTLQNTEMSLAVPISNSLTFVFTAISGWFVGEGRPNSRMLAGMLIVLVGISLCVYDKSQTV